MWVMEDDGIRHWTHHHRHWWRVQFMRVAAVAEQKDRGGSQSGDLWLHVQQTARIRAVHQLTDYIWVAALAPTVHVRFKQVRCLRVYA